MSGKKKMVYIDCTDTIRSGISTGIQRTVRNIISRTTVLKNENFIFIPVIFLYGRMYKYNHNKNHNKKLFTETLSKTFSLLRNCVDGIFGKNSVTSSFVSSGNSSIMCPNNLHSRFVYICRKVMPFFFLLAYRFDDILLDLTPIDTNSSDIIFYADAFWNIPDIYEGFSVYKKATKFVLIYDILPITNPECFDDMTVDLFKENLQKIMPWLHGIITISKSEMLSIATYLKKLTIDDKILLDFNHLGGDFAQLQFQNYHVREQYREAMESGNTFLIVGTLEPRKNLTFVLDAFEKLWDVGVNASLCIIGKIGWKYTTLLERIKYYQLSGKPLYFFNDANDQELAFCYYKSKAVIFASVAEGFGLPLVEAMSYGKEVLASDISVFHEIGEDYPLFFPLDNPEGLSRLIEDCHTKISIEKPARQWLSWSESVENLFNKIIGMVNEIELRQEKL